MSELSAEECGDLAEELLPIAAELTVLVHGDGGREDIEGVIGRLNPYQRDALLVVLAGLVNPDEPMSAQLAWLHFDEHGRPLRPAVVHSDTLRDLADEEDEVVAEDDFIDEAAVSQYLAGKRVPVTDIERIEAIAEGVRRGMSYPQFDAMHGLTKGATSTFVSRARKRAEKAGRPFPEMEHATSIAVLTETQVIEIRERASTREETDQEIALAFGVARKTVSSVATGDSYRQYGGPIRPKKTSKATAQQRVAFAGGTPAIAQAS